jgi:hypothetical protein
MGPGPIRLLRPRTGVARWLRAVACALTACAIFASTQASAQQVDGDTATARTQVAILTPGSVAKESDMDFGKIAQSNSTGTVVISPTLVATCTPSGTLIRSGACKSARFSVYGKKNKRVLIRENNNGMITLNGPAGATMFVDNLTIGVNGMSAKQGAVGWDFGSWKIDAANGITEFYVGGTLHIGAAQTPGVYNGTLLIQIQLN